MKSRMVSLFLLAALMSLAIVFLAISCTETQTPKAAKAPTNTATVTPKATRTSTPVEPRPPFGVQMYGDINDVEARTKATEAGMLWVRLSLWWKSIEPDKTAPPTYNWGGYDTMFARANDDGFAVLGIVGNSPSWAVEDTGVDCGPIDPEDLPAFASFVEALVERYDGDSIDDAPGSPVVKYWEFWNEPDQIEGADWVGGCWGGDRDSDRIPDSREYVDMLSHAYPAVKAANPEAKVLLGALAWEDYQGLFNTNFLDEVLGYGGAQHFDITNIHKYDFRRNDWDGWENGQAGTGPDQGLPWRQGILGKIAAAREKVDKPVVVSEIGEDRRKRGEEKHAMHLVHELVRGLSVWPNELKTMIWFLLVDEYPPNPTGDFGLLSNPSNPDWPPYHEFMAYWAYKTLTSELGEVEAFDYQLGPDPDPNGTTGSKYIQAFRFLMKDGGKKLVLWTDDGKRLKYAQDKHIQMAIGQAELGETSTGTLQLRVVGSTPTSYPPNEWIVEDGDAGDLDQVVGQITLEITWDPMYIQLVR